jgi:hypothetical protein
MAKVIDVFGMLGTRALVTRESAQRLRPAIAEALAKGTNEVALDFSETLGITPSFMDELLQVIQDSLRESRIPELRLTLKNPPTRLSLKFTALTKGRGAQMTEAEASTWIVALRASPASASRS